MKMKRVIVESYDPQWPGDFEHIRQELSQALGDLALAIHHIGSTSVPDLFAKPIIDIDVEIVSYAVFPRVVARLAEVGYSHEGDLGISKREAFCYEGKSHLRKHHLYVCPSDSEELHRQITFRNYLRSHPEAVKAYGAIKEEAARLFPDSIDDYMVHKSVCIEQLYLLCGLKK